jgi:amidohydrolase
MAQFDFIDKQVKRLSAQLVEWRRLFHQYPELSFQEFETSRFVAKTLTAIKGMKVEEGIGVETSVIGTLSNGEGPTIAIRADLDALPINEENRVSYASKHKGVMHACGHDAHTSILLGVANIFGEMFNQEKIQGTVKFIFQPAEESTDEHGLSGSPYLLQAGAYENVDAAIALHMCPWLPVGAVQVNDGYSMANVDVFKGKISGTGGHGAYPEMGSDPIWMLGPVMQALHGIVSRRISALDAGVISIGQIHAGTASNIIPSEVMVEGTIRSYTPEVRDLLAGELENAFSISENLGGSYSLQVQKGEPALNNNPIINSLLTTTIKELFPHFSITKERFGMGGEDFGYVTKHLPGSMFFLGCAPNDGVQRDLHTSIFDINEACLPVGLEILTQSAVKFLRGEVGLTHSSGGVIESET